MRVKLSEILLAILILLGILVVGVRLAESYNEGFGGFWLINYF